jgi:PAS domain S-box-containing protein
VVFTALAVLLRWLLDPWLGDSLPFPTLFGSVALAVWLGGYRPALLAAVLGYLACDVLFKEPRGSLALDGAGNLIGLLAYLVSCAVIIGFGEAMRSARLRAEAHRDRLEQEVTRRRDAEERFRRACEVIKGVVYEHDLLTGHVERTRGLYEILGYRPDEVPPTADWWREQIHPDDRQAAGHQLKKAAAAGTAVFSEYRVRHKDGRWLHVEDRAVLLRDGAGCAAVPGEPGKAVRLMGVTLDITGRKQAEEALCEADRRKDEFLATLAHELRNPLAPLRSGLEIIRLAGNDRAAVEQARAMMDRQLHHLVRSWTTCSTSAALAAARSSCTGSGSTWRPS